MCTCLLACLDQPLTVNFKWMHSNVSQRLNFVSMTMYQLSKSDSEAVKSAWKRLGVHEDNWNWSVHGYLHGKAGCPVTDMHERCLYIYRAGFQFMIRVWSSASCSDWQTLLLMLCVWSVFHDKVWSQQLIQACSTTIKHHPSGILCFCRCGWRSSEPLYEKGKAEAICVSVSPVESVFPVESRWRSRFPWQWSYTEEGRVLHFQLRVHSRNS